ncbi:MAG: hypothetical protein IJR35_01465 [Synergistaceae bacterium]|nr:hypothetical protein [Synergistaceae bacterium]MBQ9404806.1 hypothetical protein [Synergistaceae bacterium]MBQ9594509.1 hypothetical protein [Synergistaceae bacterium]
MEAHEFIRVRVHPDEIDLQMLKEIEEDPECREFVSSEEVMKSAGYR